MIIHRHYWPTKSGVDGILVGDSLGMTTLGHKTTIPVTMDAMILHAEAVARGAKGAFSCGRYAVYVPIRPPTRQQLKNAGRFIRSGMDAVKVEGAMIDRIKAIADAGILVQSHLGLTPHTRAKLGGYRGPREKQPQVLNLF